MSRHSFRHALCGSCGLFGLSLLVCLPVQAQFVSTATKALPLQNATLLGRVNPAAAMHVIVSLKLRNASLVQPTLKRMVTTDDFLFGQPYSVSQFVSQFAPTTSQVAAVEQYLTANGFKNLTVESNQLLIQADANAQEVETAFNTVLSSFKLNRKTVYANTMDAQVPTSLSSTVLAVLGLNKCRRHRCADPAQHVEPIERLHSSRLQNRL